MPRPAKKAKTTGVTRIDPGARMSEASVWDGIVYLAGQVAGGDAAKGDITVQTTAVLKQIDELLAKAGTDKTHILRAQIYLPSIADFAAMNAVWEGWVAKESPPSRATVEAKLANAFVPIALRVGADHARARI